MVILESSAARGRLESQARRIFAAVLSLGFIEVVFTELGQRNYFNNISDISLATFALSIIGVAISSFGSRAQNNFWLWTCAAVGLLIVLLLPLMTSSAFPSDGSAQPWVWWTVGWSALAAGVTGNRVGFIFFLPVISGSWLLVYVMVIDSEQAWINGLKDSAYVFLIAGAVSGLIGLTRSWATRVDQANSELIMAYVDRAKSDAVEKEGQVIDSLIHDSVLHTFLVSATAKSTAQQKAVAVLATQSIAKLQELENPEEIDNSVSVLGLFRALKVAITSMSPNVSVELRTGRKPRVTMDVGQALTGATLQAVDNALAHAKATKIDVILDLQSGDLLSITVADDGIGFKPDRVPGDRLGIKLSILAKMQNVGGSADIASSSRNGTKVSLRWPN
ncbi:MAG: ATP-binding protein [Aquiluna sp.]|nr:ATP-binding protein [Aquiluna sp.]